MIEAKKIKKIVKGKTIIDSIDLKFSDSGFYCLSGDNGAGKSTLLGILGLLDSSYEGELIINSLNCIVFVPPFWKNIIAGFPEGILN